MKLNTPTTDINEAVIKCHLLAWLLARKKITPAHVVTQELFTPNRDTRADLVIVGRHTHAYEIKSNKDTLTRLPNQISTFAETFDKVSVVVDVTHKEKALQLVPDGIELLIVSFADGEFNCVRAKQGRISKIRDKSRLISLLTAQELIAPLRKYQLVAGRPKRKQLEELAINLPIKVLRETLIQAMHKRYSYSSNQFIKALQEQGIVQENLDLLRKSPRERYTDENISRQDWDKILTNLEDYMSSHSVSVL